MQIARLLLVTSATLLSVVCFGLQVDSAKNSIQHGNSRIKTGLIEEERLTSSGKSEARSRRQLFRKKRKQTNLLSALNRFVYDTVNDTSIAYRNISTILSDQFGGKAAMKNNSTTGNGTMSGTSSNRPTPIFSMQQLFDLLGRNYRGLVKLFNTEFRSAIDASNKNVARYQKELKDSIKLHFLPNRNITDQT